MNNEKADAILRHLQKHPIAPAAYAGSKELLSSISLTEPCGGVTSSSAHVLGSEPGKREFLSGYPETPSQYIHEMRDILLYHMLLLGEGARYFPESIRIRPFHRPPPKLYSALLRGEALGAGYFVLLEKTGQLDCPFLERPCTPLFTFPAFGHFLLEDLPRLWLLFQAGVTDVQIPLSPATRVWKTLLLEMLAPFGFNESNVTPMNGPVAFMRRAFIASQPFMHTCYMHNAARKAFEKIRNYYGSGTEKKRLRMYVSRIGAEKRQLVNEQECIEVAKRYGFMVIQPERHSFASQVALFSEASHIAGPIGSGLHNAVFSPEDAKMLALKSPHNFFPLPTYAMIERAYNRSLSIFEGKYISDESRSPDGSWYADPSLLASCLEQWL